MPALTDTRMTLEERFLIRTLVEAIQAETGEDLFAEMTEGLRAVVAGVLHTGRPGSVQLTFSVKAVHFRATGKWSAGRVTAAAEVTTKKPAAKRSRARGVEFYVTEGGELTATAPEQGAFGEES